MDYGKLNGTIEGYEASCSLFGRLTIKSDSLLAIQNLSSHGDDFSKLGALSSHFLDSMDYNFTSFSHGYRTDNHQVHLLAKSALVSNVPLKWS